MDYRTTPVGLTFTELAGGENHNPTQAATWEDWGLPAIIPAGAVAALIDVEHLSTTAHTLGVRKNGTALVRSTAMQNKQHRVMLTEVDANRVVEVYASQIDAVVAKFSVLGYWS